MHKLLLSLQLNGWRVVENATLTIPDWILARYNKLPKDWIELFSRIECCEDPCAQSWFVTPLDMHGTSGSAFAWNEAEKQSLEAAKGDHEWADKIRHYWSNHLPIMFSVANGYEAWAICLNGINKGKIIHSIEPDYEDGSVVPESLIEFIDMIARKS